MGIGAYRHLVTLEHPSGVVYPTTWYCSMQSASAQVSDGLAAFFIRGRYHPGITLETQINWEGRTFQVQGITDLDERHAELQIVAVEVVARGKALDRTAYIVQQPIGTVMLAESSWTLEVEAGGTPPLAYQWMADGVIIPGATGQNYVTGPLEATTVFSVRVSNAYGFVTSAPATVTVVYAPEILEHPESIEIAPGESATLTVVAAGTPPLAYQWLEDGADIPGATSASYVTGPLTETTVYSVQVANGYGAVLSDPATVEVVAEVTYQDLVVADGAIAYWPLDDPSGTTARDLVGSRHGTITGGVTLNQSGVNGSVAMDFNGTTGEINIAATPTLIPQFSHEVWVRSRDVAGQRAIYGRAWNLSGGCVWDHEGTLRFQQQLPRGNVFGGSLTADAWAHCVVTHDGATLKLYINSAETATGLYALNVGDSEIPGKIGALDPFGLHWNGLVQDLAIYPRALTPAEIAAHYAKRLEA